MTFNQKWFWPVLIPSKGPLFPKEFCWEIPSMATRGPKISLSWLYFQTLISGRTPCIPLDFSMPCFLPLSTLKESTIKKLHLSNIFEKIQFYWTIEDLQIWSLDSFFEVYIKIWFGQVVEHHIGNNFGCWEPSYNYWEQISVFVKTEIWQHFFS